VGIKLGFAAEQLDQHAAQMEGISEPQDQSSFGEEEETVAA